jgi:hypothetical protein
MMAPVSFLLSDAHATALNSMAAAPAYRRVECMESSGLVDASRVERPNVL